MNAQIIRPVILCGGSGKRLWPVSRKSMPKQFARLGGPESLLQTTVRRLEDAGCGAPLFMTGEAYRFVVAAQADEIGLSGHRVVIEPEGRNTAPAICAAAELLYESDPEALMLVAPADHQIADPLAFAAALAEAATVARAGNVVVFGIRPDRPETGYGYVELAGAAAFSDGAAQPFRSFVEKPDLAGAEAMLASGRYVWNAGIFLMPAALARKLFGQHAPRVRSSVRRALREAKPDLDFLRLGPAFAAAPEIAFDHAVMEHVAGYVQPLNAGWNDLGSWRSVWSESDRDADGVAAHGATLARGCRDSLLFSADPAVQVVGLGLRNIAAVATRDAVLITDLDQDQGVGAAVELLKTRGAAQAEQFARHERPWGHYETLSLGPRFQVKSIVVKPGGTLSLQSHVHRAEHWVVVEGTARVTIGERDQLVSENQSVYIPLGEIHRLANEGRVPLQLIEVQTGAYLGEDDIKRYEDIYERT